MNILRKLILGCFGIDSRDNIPSIEALAMAGVDYAIVQAPFIDQPHLNWREWHLCFPFSFRLNDNISDDDEETEYSTQRKETKDYFCWSELFTNVGTTSHSN